MKPPKKLPPLLSVVWTDAFSTDEWTDLEELPKEPLACKSVGYMVGETKEMVSLAGTISEDGQACTTIHIPKGWIKERHRLGRS